MARTLSPDYFATRLKPKSNLYFSCESCKFFKGLKKKLKLSFGKCTVLSLMAHNLSLLVVAHLF